MKKLTKYVSIIVLFCICLSLDSPYAYAINQLPEEEIVIGETIIMSGVRVDINDFNRAFCGEKENRIPVEECESYSAVTARLVNVVVTETDISFMVSVVDEESNVTNQVLHGQWGAGSKYINKQENSITVTFDENENAQLRPVLFNCYNDTEKNNLLLGIIPDYNPHLKFYLEDSNGQIILLEGELPEFLQVTPNLNWNTDSSDTVWFTKYVQLNTVKIPTNQLTVAEKEALGIPTVETSELASFSMWGPYTYKGSGVVGGQNAKYYSMPYVEYLHMPTEPESTWSVFFKVAEHINVDGTVLNGVNPYLYSDVYIGIVAGANTRFIGKAVAGRYISNGFTIEDGEDAVIKALDLVTGGSTSLFISLWNSATDQTVKLGSEDDGYGNNSASYSSVVRSAGIGIPKTDSLSYQYLSTSTNSSNGHYIGANFQMSYYNDAGSPETDFSTTGYLAFKFNVYQQGNWDEPIDEIELVDDPNNTAKLNEQIIELPYTTGLS